MLSYMSSNDLRGSACEPLWIAYRAVLTASVLKWYEIGMTWRLILTRTNK